jgi:glucuronokinase
LIITSTSYPRAALIGNPSDGYFGKTIAFVFSNFKAEVLLFESPELEILPANYDSNIFTSIRALVDDVNLYGYYGGIRLLKAAVKRFSDYCSENNIMLPEKNFTLRYKSDIPFRLGLAGSSAIITACFRSLMKFYAIKIPNPLLANLVLSVEVDELKISAGLQDRVSQAYECPVYMNFDEKLMKTKGYGQYVTIDRDLFPMLYIAYRKDLSEGSEVVHNNFRERFNFHEPDVIEAIKQWSNLTDQVKDCLLTKKLSLLPELINRNFDIRKSVMNISKENLLMVATARSSGASAKFTGSGGAIIGTYKDEKMFNRLKIILNEIGVEVIKPQIVSNNCDDTL